MTGGVRNWRTELIEAHHGLFQPPAGNPEAAAGWPACGVGWHDLLARMCVRIRGAIQADGDTFRLSEIKEKYGSLRVSWDGSLSPEASAQVEEAIALAETASACTCEVCGEFGRLHGDGWLTTRCASHAGGRPIVETRPEFEHIDIVHHFAGGATRVICRRYDRETDSFQDVDPTSLRSGE